MGEAIIVEVEPDMLDNVWNKVAILLKPAVDRNETLSLLDVYELVKKRLARLYVAVKEKDMFAAFVLEKVRGIQKSFLRVVLAAGEPMNDWLNPFLKLMKGLLIEENLEFYELIGRPGWERVLKEIGYKPSIVFRIRPTESI